VSGHDRALSEVADSLHVVFELSHPAVRGEVSWLDVVATIHQIAAEAHDALVIEILRRPYGRPHGYLLPAVAEAAAKWAAA